ncbi:Coiled-coil domain-containing protein 155 [Tupaia chinensis]|uniref:Coiled-coil domain-containing protein 155 n=1 Tax=Tupaia chinensis TaxID=246437 RepID=L9J9F2_TUPCH|nr:Coiled-coil domain-containing protein 155 [Tupaia chinensis]
MRDLAGTESSRPETQGTPLLTGGLGPSVSSVYLWEQPETASPGALLSLEEQILNSTFEACDPQKTGTVAVARVLAYLEAVTGQGPQDARLQTLAHNLDPRGEGPRATVDLDTFLVVMRDWIAACQLHGPATIDLLSSLEDLELSNRRLAGENAKLQRSVETAEEGSARLGEEILALRKQLRSTQQALQSAKAVDEELEDLKTLAKSLEEQNRSLLAQARQMEKEQQHLVTEMETLQEENGKLLAERDGVKRRNEELATEKDTLKDFGEVEERGSLGKLDAQREGRAKGSPGRTDGRLLPWQRQLCECERLICQRDAILSERTQHAESLAKTLEEYRATAQELRLEISQLEEQLSRTQEGPDERPAGAQVRRVAWTELLPQSLGLEIEAIQQKQDMAAAALSSPLCGVWQCEEVFEEVEEEAEFHPEVPARGQVDLPISQGDPSPGDSPGSPPKSPAEPELQQALVPVSGELGLRRRQPWGQLCLPIQQLRVTQPPLIPAPVLGLLLLLLLSVLLLGQPASPTWPHLQLCYLQPPPV